MRNHKDQLTVLRIYLGHQQQTAKQCYLLVVAKTTAKFPNCGDLLRALTTCEPEERDRGDGKNVRDWVIRSQGMLYVCKVQRVDGNWGSLEPLRCTLALSERIEIKQDIYLNCWV